jgi:precorrin-6A/cobalt-precorrin-6A reductase
MAALTPLCVLILGGTGEGYELARALSEVPHLQVVSSLAGRTRRPRLPQGEVRIGGFGGASGLAEYIRDRGAGAVIDATHPFAATMGWHAAAAAEVAGVPLLRLERPPWCAEPADDWHEVGAWDEAADLVRRLARRVLLAIGRQEIGPFAAIATAWFLIRAVEAPDPMPAFPHAELLLARGPFDLAGERELLARHRIDTIVCKNSGGSATEAKLIAARALGLRVVMRRRPPRPELPTVRSTEAALVWLEEIRTR